MYRFNPFICDFDWTESGEVTSHSILTNLSNDDHAQYALLAGRAGGQTLIGGIASGNNLTLQSTSHATKGKILFGTSAYDEVNNRLGIGTANPSYLVHAVSSGSEDAIMAFESGTTDVNARFVASADTTAKLPSFALFDRNAAAYTNSTDFTNTFHISLDRTSALYGARNDVIFVQNYQDKALHFITNNAGSKGVRMSILGNGNVGIGITAPTSRIHGVTTLSADTGNEIAYQLNYTTNKLTSGNDTGLLINQTDTASPGTSLLIDAQVGGVSKAQLSNTGTFSIDGLLYINDINSANYIEIGSNGGLSITGYGTTRNIIIRQSEDISSGDFMAIAGNANIELTAASGAQNFLRIAPNINQSGTAAATDLLINRTQTAVGSGAQLLIDAQVGGVSKFKVDNTGGLFLPAIKSGATQAGASAAAGELWKTASHATLPDNVVMIGV